MLGWPAAWPSPACLLVGPSGSGKTHLAKVWARRSGAVFLRGRELWGPAEPLRRLGDAAACVVDDAEELAQEPPLFHLYNRLAERRGGLLLTARRPSPPGISACRTCARGCDGVAGAHPSRPTTSSWRRCW